MKVTRLGPPLPILNSGLGPNAGSRIPSGGLDLQVLTSNGSNGRYWGENVARITANSSNTLLSPYVNFAAGSNTIFSVSSNTLTIHGQAGGGGVSGITSNGSNSVTGAINLQAGTGIALGVSGSTITITNTGSGGGGSGGAATTNEYLTTATAADLSAEVVIPGLAGSPDILPASPHASDLEFDTSTIGGTALGSPDTIDADTTIRSHLYISEGANSAFALVGRYWSVPSMPFTMTAKISDVTMPNAQFARGGIGVAEATPGKTQGIYTESVGARVISTISSTTPTTGAAYVTAGGSGTDTWSGLPVYFRCVVVSSTDITWYVSFGGHIFRRHGSANINPGFTIGSFFVAANPENATYPLSIAVDWIRFT